MGFLDSLPGAINELEHQHILVSELGCFINILFFKCFWRYTKF